ncbi:MAG: hypothetical protein A2787_05710 [Omnitrophica WOR_2 bacterium RIFCSPHIGHO2_01_FULL_48_9]|nr:MAG: hypothetical protein A3D10_08905 [Omnitrophica WOR_2 bacterium RIFCSPHIGHO2_02_FULL_48_11]OGX30645.1 MAG: hypothetical protein A2787_05710 [Omnitrophica WOR_2 bacterium RIFCSPHIGHO2_01_FULL_48_9]
MKRAIRLLLVVIFALSFTAPLFAASPDPIHKIKKGAMDIISVPYDIGKTTLDETKAADFKPFGLLGGLGKGTVEGVKKAVMGAWDIVTFPLDYLKK